MSDDLKKSDAQPLRDLKGIGLALSGGGYKAASFHLGGLYRLNELGQLPLISRIASVSGGSIAAAFLGANWHKLDFGPSPYIPLEPRVASNFDEVIARPLQKFLTHCSAHGPNKWMAIGQFTLKAVLPFLSNPRGLAAFYKTNLFENKALTLQNLPDPAGDLPAPEFVILATDLRLNSLWRFSRLRARNSHIGEILAPDFPLENMVAASSGFPPFLCPIMQTFAPGSVQPIPGRAVPDKHFAPYTEIAELCDGGIFDNMGLEPIWSDYATVMISNAGDPFEETEKPDLFWLLLAQRVLSMIHRQAENNRIRWMYDRVGRPGQPSRLVHWPLRALREPYKVPSACHLDPKAVEGAMNQTVMLTALKDIEFANLANHGYLRADAATRSFLGLETYCDAKLPFLVPDR